MEKGFFGSLFDLSFTSFVTPKLIKILFLISLAVLAIAYIWIAVALFTSGGGYEVGSDGTLREEGGNTALGVLWLLILGPLTLFFYTLLYRVFFELIIVLFRIFENSRDQVSLLRAAFPDASRQVPETGHFDQSPPASAPPAGGPAEPGPGTPPPASP